MLRLWSRLLVILLCAIISSCGFADFQQIELIIEPNESGSLLPESYSPVKLRFNTNMYKIETENMLQVISDSGFINGDLYWEGNDLLFIPIEGWAAGTLYALSLSGIFRAVDGRELQLERFISFYAVNTNAPPLLEWYSPADGESTGTNNTALEFHFSRPMDRITVESALAVGGITNRTFEWSNEDKTIKIIPDRELTPWTFYRWNLADNAKSLDGVPLPKTYSGHFITNTDQTLPQVTNVFPVLNSGGRWYPTGLDIETGLGYGHGIAIEFNKPMSENAFRSIRFEPYLSGRAEFLTEKSIVYIFSASVEPLTTYTLIISGDTTDCEGLKLGDEYRINFLPDIPILNILSFTVDAHSPVTDFSTANSLAVQVDPVINNLSFTIHFSLPASRDEKLNTALRVSLIPFFPKTLAPVTLSDVTWISDDRLRMRWEGLEGGDNNEPHYYKLTIPGGKSGIKSGEGIYMKEEMIIYLEAVK